MLSYIHTIVYGLEQFAGVSQVIAVIASFPQQTENRTFFPVL